MNIQSKGQARTLLLIILIIIGVYIFFFYLNILLSGIRIGAEKFQEDIFTIHNALGPARLYCKTSLRYTVYQGMYGLGYTGGFSIIPDNNLYNWNALWYDNGDIYPSEDTLLENLGSVVLVGMNMYTMPDYTFLDEYTVELPEYTEIEVSKTPDGKILVKATPDKNLLIEETIDSTGTIRLERSGELEENFGPHYLGLYQKALERLEGVKDRFGEIKAELEKVRTGTLTREQEGSLPQITEDEVFLKALEDAGIGAASKEDGESKIRAKLTDIINLLRDQAGETTVQFKKTVSFSVADLKEAECSTEESQRTEESKTLYSLKKTCSFSYDYNFTVNVTVTDNSGKRYPVFNTNKDEASMEPLTMFFVAREWSKASVSNYSSNK